MRKRILLRLVNLNVEITKLANFLIIIAISLTLYTAFTLVVRFDLIAFLVIFDPVCYSLRHY